MIKPTEKPSEHERLEYRLSDMLIRLNSGEQLDKNELMARYKISYRTLQRDINQRFAMLPLHNHKGIISLDPHYLGKYSTKDIHQFAQMIGAKCIFPNFDNHQLAQLLDTRLRDTIAIQQYGAPDNPEQATAFEQLRTAIAQRQECQFEYQKNIEPTAQNNGETHSKTTRHVRPYRLIHNQGAWYLIAQEVPKAQQPASQPINQSSNQSSNQATAFDEPLKSFSLRKISTIRVLNTSFRIDTALQQRIDQEDSIWMRTHKQRVILHISAPVAEYFTHSQLTQQQRILTTHADGSLQLECHVADARQITPIVQSWLPHIRIESPAEWQTDMQNMLQNYCKTPTQKPPKAP